MADDARRGARALETAVDDTRVPMEAVCGEFVEATATALAEFWAVERAAGAVAVPFHMTGLATPMAIIDEEGCRVAFSSSWTREMNDASERYSGLGLTMDCTVRDLAAAIDLRADEAIKDCWKKA